VTGRQRVAGTSSPWATSAGTATAKEPTSGGWRQTPTLEAYPNELNFETITPNPILIIRPTKPRSEGASDMKATRVFLAQRVSSSNFSQFIHSRDGNFLNFVSGAYSKSWLIRGALLGLACCLSTSWKTQTPPCLRPRCHSCGCARAAAAAGFGGSGV